MWGSRAVAIAEVSGPRGAASRPAGAGARGAGRPTRSAPRRAPRPVRRLELLASHLAVTIGVRRGEMLLEAGGELGEADRAVAVRVQPLEARRPARMAHSTRRRTVGTAGARRRSAVMLGHHLLVVGAHLLGGDPAVAVRVELAEHLAGMLAKLGQADLAIAV